MKASSTDRGTFTGFNDAVDHMARYSGIGLGVFDDLAAVDIDHYVMDGALSEMAQDIIGIMEPGGFMKADSRTLQRFRSIPFRVQDIKMFIFVMLTKIGKKRQSLLYLKKIPSLIITDNLMTGMSMKKTYFHKE